MATWYWYPDTAIVMFVQYEEKYIINIIKISSLPPSPSPATVGLAVVP